MTLNYQNASGNQVYTEGHTRAGLRKLCSLFIGRMGQIPLKVVDLSQ